MHVSMIQGGGFRELDRMLAKNCTEVASIQGPLRGKQTISNQQK